MTKQQTIGIIVGGLLVLVLSVLGVRLYNRWLGARSPIPPLSESMIGGAVKADTLPLGEHTLKLRARTKQGEVIEDTVTFTIEESTYGCAGSYGSDQDCKCADPYNTSCKDGDSGGDPYKKP
jgi:hypothetical protein